MPFTSILQSNWQNFGAPIQFGNSIISQPAPDNPICMKGITKTEKDCCRLPSLVDQSIDNRCALENPTMISPSAKKTEGCCIAQCVLTTLNALENDTVDRAALKKSFLVADGIDRNFSPLFNNTIDDCSNVINNNSVFKATPVSSVLGRPGCSFIPEGFFDCVKSSLFQRCPVAVWDDISECKQLKQKLSAGCSFASLTG
ncbi:uncharacterized protein LOC129724764 [Wyeomyia smithii]|uniref:uncharacterized protein LOC129724764 n=1 Tax=Wyeomyia smithii TaxID=174621 RepID=UPI0024680BC1|nr:uncharacterized protein LOC129724764 [Wyeomyia smithii]